MRRFDVEATKNIFKKERFLIRTAQKLDAVCVSTYLCKYDHSLVVSTIICPNMSKMVMLTSPDLTRYQS